MIHREEYGKIYELFLPEKKEGNPYIKPTQPVF